MGEKALKDLRPSKIKWLYSLINLLKPLTYIFIEFCLFYVIIWMGIVLLYLYNPDFLNHVNVSMKWDVFSQGRAYFRIQGKRLTCSKRAPYLGDTSWPDSPKLMKVLVTIGLNRLSSLHIPSWHITLFAVSYFLSEILRIPNNGRNRNLEILLLFFFKKLPEIPSLNCKIHGEIV